jgi:hypothetical protein
MESPRESRSEAKRIMLLFRGFRSVLPRTCLVERHRWFPKENPDMTPAERLYTALSGGVPDRVPVVPKIWVVLLLAATVTAVQAQLEEYQFDMGTASSPLAEAYHRVDCGLGVGPC